jgi:CBS domain-containing protein
MQAQDVMTRTVATVREDSSLSAAIALMLEKRVSGLPVLDQDDRVVGVLTEGDLLRRAETDTEKSHQGWWKFIMGSGHMAADYVRTHSRKVGDLMTRDPVVSDEEAPLDELVSLMERKHIKRVPIVRHGLLKGIVSRADLIRVLARALQSPEDVMDVPDAMIHARIVAEMERQNWAPDGSITVEVDNGHVVLSGVIFDVRDRAAMRVAAENVAGVRSVRDELTWVDATSGMAMGA